MMDGHCYIIVVHDTYLGNITTQNRYWVISCFEYFNIYHYLLRKISKFVLYSCNKKIECTPLHLFTKNINFKKKNNLYNHLISES